MRSRSSSCAAWRVRARDASCCFVPFTAPPRSPGLRTLLEQAPRGCCPAFPVSLRHRSRRSARGSGAVLSSTPTTAGSRRSSAYARTAVEASPAAGAASSALAVGGDGLFVARRRPAAASPLFAAEMEAGAETPTEAGGAASGMAGSTAGASGAAAAAAEVEGEGGLQPDAASRAPARSMRVASVSGAPTDAAAALPMLDAHELVGMFGSVPYSQDGKGHNVWCSLPADALKVRGPHYLSDRVKVASAPAAFVAIAVDMVATDERLDCVAEHPNAVVQRVLAYAAEQGRRPPFMMVVNMQMPGDPQHSMIAYMARTLPEGEDAAFDTVFNRFLDGDSAYRDRKIKMIPGIAEGNWIVKRSVGNKPAILGTKLLQQHFTGEAYAEADVDVGSSSMAVGVLKVVKGYAKSLVIDLGFVLEGDQPDELPERVLGAVRMVNIDLLQAPRL